MTAEQAAIAAGKPARRRGRRGAACLGMAAMLIIGAVVWAFGLWEGYRRSSQMQADPRVARAWIVGTTFGPVHTIERGSHLQRWLNGHNIFVLGKYERLQSTLFNNPGSLEIWFNYQSFLMGNPDLECHRVAPSGTAFYDDLGQVYHGFLDIHGDTVGVYLPGYDRSAHEIHCALRWMPRKPAPPFPVSRPMEFTVKLPYHPRVLPASDSLPRRAVVTRSGVTVTIDAARLGPFKQAPGTGGQRNLTFRMRIDGGEIANQDFLSASPDLHVIMGNSGSAAGTMVYSRNRIVFSSGSVISTMNASDAASFAITDPYGESILSPGQSPFPIVSKDLAAATRRGEGTVWSVPVDSVGKGTDVISMHLDILPNVSKSARPKPAQKPVPIDILVPVQTGDEI